MEQRSKMKQLLYFLCALYGIIGCISYVQSLQDEMWYRDYASDNMTWINRMEFSSVTKTYCALVVLKKEGSCFGFQSKTDKCYMKSGGDEMEIMDNVDVYCTNYSAHVGTVAASETTTQSTTTEQTTTKICRETNITHRTIYYCIYTTEKNWSDARSTCQNDGGDLLVAEDPRMLRFVPDDQFFFGMYHIQSNGDFEFVNGRTQSNVTIQNNFWEQNHPDSNAVDWCGYVKKLPRDPGPGPRHRRVVWFSSPCAAKMSFICEIPMASN